MKRSLIVPGSLSSALQMTNFSGPGALRAPSHFVCRKSGASHALQLPVFQRAQRFVEGLRLHQFAEYRVVLGWTGVRVAFEHHAAFTEAAGRLGRPLLFRMSDVLFHQPHGGGEGLVFVHVFVDDDHGRVVTAADAGNVADLDGVYASTGRAEVLLQRLAQLLAAAQVTGHVIADANVDGGRRLEAKVREEAGNSVHIADMHSAPLGNQLYLPRGDIACAVLDLPEVLWNRLGGTILDLHGKNASEFALHGL